MNVGLIVVLGYIVVAGSLTLHRWSIALTDFRPQFSSSWVSSNCYKSINECFSISIQQPISYFYCTCYILFHVHWHQKQTKNIALHWVTSLN